MVTISHLTDADIAYVCALAEEAGTLAVRMREGVEIREKTGPQDLVTAADCALSHLITTGLKNRFADDLVISEEDTHHTPHQPQERIWLVDPIDGTDNYVRNDGQYSVMIGLLVEMVPVFGWVYAPHHETLYFGGPEFGTFIRRGPGQPVRHTPTPDLDTSGTKRLMMGFRDRKSHPWVMDLADVQLIKSGSIGLKVAKVLDDEADLFVHLSGKLKVWDTAGPVAIAIGAGLEVGQLEADGLTFRLPQLQQECTVIIGRRGALLWSRANLIPDANT